MCAMCEHERSEVVFTSRKRVTPAELLLHMRMAELGVGDLCELLDRDPREIAGRLTGRLRCTRDESSLLRFVALQFPVGTA